MRRPDIKTELPGPKAAAIIERDNQIISHSLPREYPLVIAKGKGVWVDDPDGNRFLDFTSGIAVCNTGHCHPEVVEAAKSQLDKLIHTCGADFYHSPMVEIAEELASIAPGSDKKRIFLGNSGAEVVEAAHAVVFAAHDQKRGFKKWQIADQVTAFFRHLAFAADEQP